MSLCREMSRVKGACMYSMYVYMYKSSFLSIGSFGYKPVPDTRIHTMHLSPLK